MEIGSEFNSNSNMSGINNFVSLSTYPKKYFLSGRTGLAFVAKQLNGLTSEILLPEYCCGSMIAPFAIQNFKIKFYDSFNLNNFEVDESKQAVLIMDYFGFISDETADFAKKCKDCGKIIIVDATQSAFSYSDSYKFADYIVASYRKWLDCLCAVVYSKKGFDCFEHTKKHLTYTKKWRRAAEIKTDYLNGLCENKQEFLELYAEANHLLDGDYFDYIPDDNEVSVLNNTDSFFLQKRRRENAAFLINKIKQIPEIQLIFDNIRDGDCPLFVPILVDENKRSAIRGSLIQNNIYCPAHWPIDNRFPHCITKYHNSEISLICDQRYGLEAMEKQIKVLADSFKIH